MTLLVLFLIGMFGLMAHWVKKWGRGQTKAGFSDYMLSHKKHSIASVSALLGAIVTVFMTADVELTNQTLAMAFMAGFSIDSAVNKSPEEK